MTFTVNGSNFVAGVDVELGDNIFVHQTTRVNSNTLTVWASVFNDAPSGTVDVIVCNKDGQWAALEH